MFVSLQLCEDSLANMYWRWDTLHGNDECRKCHWFAEELEMRIERTILEFSAFV